VEFKKKINSLILELFSTNLGLKCLVLSSFVAPKEKKSCYVHNQLVVSLSLYGDNNYNYGVQK
jgi:hypothetical protein